jgi:hypothetical protein
LSREEEAVKTEDRDRSGMVETEGDLRRAVAAKVGSDFTGTVRTLVTIEALQTPEGDSEFVSEAGKGTKILVSSEVGDKVNS